MSVLVTRPHPDNAATAAALGAMGIAAVLAPILRFEPVQSHGDADAAFDGVIVTSANALRAVENGGDTARLLELPLFAVGGHTAEAARAAGFRNVVDAGGDAAALAERVKAALKKRKRAAVLLHLAGADLASDLAGELGAQGMTVVTQTVYRMVPVGRLPDDVCEAFAAQQIEAVLHYSRRSARAFVDAARHAGVEISALSLPQCCLSESIGAELREAGAVRVSVASAPNEAALLDTLLRALGRGSG
ncbi:MAG: uroporphyrinogen-III synthase [Pseudomonadota bacterium]